MSNIQYALTRTGAIDVLTVLTDGKLVTINNSMENWGRALEAVEADDPAALRAVLNPQAVFKTLQQVTNRVSYDNRSVYVDGDCQPEEVGDVLLSMIERANGNQREILALGRFFEKLYNNPSSGSIEQAMTWLSYNSFMLDDDGNLYGYKSYTEKDGALFASRVGLVVVNGVQYDADNPPLHPGDVVTMPRSKVVQSAYNECDTGLHVGTFEYAQEYTGNAVRMVRVDPVDIVSVPHSGHKMRVCRYEIMDPAIEPDSLLLDLGDVFDAENTELFGNVEETFNPAEDDGGEYEYCDACGNQYCYNDCWEYQKYPS